ncbi:MAG: translation initiation factor IF-1 [Bacilli bacterium]|jgi:translation initiation factor IF-1
MAKEEGIAIEGCEVIEVLGADRFKIKLPNETIITGHLAGKLRKNKIRVNLGDSVTVELSVYDITKGRIIFRKK